MMIDERRQLNRVKRSSNYVERYFVCLQPSRAFLGLKTYLLGAPDAQD